MKVLVILSCMATLVICEPIMHRRPHKHPHHSHHQQQNPQQQNPEQQNPPQLNPSFQEWGSSDEDFRTKEPKSIRGNKEPIHPEPKTVEQQSKNVPENKEPPRSNWESRFQRLPALEHEEIHDEYGQYALRYVTADNTVVSERGRLVPTADGGYVLEIEGKYQFVGDDGQLYVTSFRGGPDGFHVDAKHLPVQVPMPVI